MQRLDAAPSFLEALSAQERRELKKRLYSLNLRKGDELIRAGDQSDDVFLLVEGQLEVCLESPRGRAVTFRVIDPGDIIGEMSALDGGVRSATVTARVASHVARLSSSEFNKIVALSPDVLKFLVGRYLGFVRMLTTQVYETVALGVEERVRIELMRLAERSVKDNRATVSPCPTHKQLAAKIGTTREAVTRELNSLEKQGYIACRGREMLILKCRELTDLIAGVP